MLSHEQLVTTEATVRVDQLWCCPCGRPIKAVDFAVSAALITHTCGRCHRRLLEIELPEVEGA